VPRKSECCFRAFSDIGVPVAVDKLEGPDQSITYLGIQIDSVQQLIQLPADKCGSLVTTVDAWLGREKCKKWDLLSLIGSLSFACKVVCFCGG